MTGLALEARGVTKRFPGVLALDQVDLALPAGEITAVVGENGAGKSTLMKVLAGVHRPDAGELRIAGRAVQLLTPKDGRLAGVALIHQELALCPQLTAADNVFLGAEPRRAGLLRGDRARVQAGQWLERLGADFGPDARAGELSVAQQQLIEIAKALRGEVRVLILDEPTASLSTKECDALFEVVHGLCAEGVAVAHITHRLAEVEQHAASAVVLRDGCRVGELGRDELTRDALVRLMVGRDVVATRAASGGGGGAAGEEPARPAVLEVNGLTTRAHPRAQVDLRVAGGERVALAGLVGSGRSELLRAIFGVDRPLAGRVQVAGRSLAAGRPMDAVDAGLGLVPEDRKGCGLWLDWPVAPNLTAARVRDFASRGLLQGGLEDEHARRVIELLGVRSSGSEQPVGLLSGGNQQKVVLGRWLVGQPQALLLDEPTRGVDVGARQEIYGALDSLVNQGLGLLFASSEWEEVCALADRVLVLHSGRIAGELRPSDPGAEETYLRLATLGQA